MSERLEEIKADVEDTLEILRDSKGDRTDDVGFSPEYVASVMESQKWLIEQAERVEHLETVLIGTNKVLDESIGNLEEMANNNNRLRELRNTVAIAHQDNLERKEAENNRLREALEFYADEDNYNLNDEAKYIDLCEYIHIIDLDNGEKARQALEQKP